MLRKLAASFILFSFLAVTASGWEKPNIILIMTDDQGIGDLGVNGNPFIETPNIDRLSTESTSFENFYVHPVCTPTRACLMTGRYNYRTRAIDTYIGRAMMEPEEVTAAEMFQQAGYRTGIFGKWHLGDCYPMRAIDQGFDTALIHRGGGIGQPSDPLAAQRQYTNPILFRDGKAESFEGYCTDIYYDQAIEFISQSTKSKTPFFVYLPDNIPHGPFHDVPKDLYQYYLSKKIDRSAWGRHNRGKEFSAKDADFLARVYAMIGNVDRNIGKLLDTLDDLKIADDTIVIFMCDNGPNSQRYVMGYRGSKASVYEGGIRSPCWIRWPNRIAAGNSLSTLSAHIDILPTLLGLADLEAFGDQKLDGIDHSAELQGKPKTTQPRNLFIQSHRGNQPTRYHHMAVRNSKWKLVHPSGFGKQQFDAPPQFELYDMVNDPKESQDVSTQHPQVVKQMRQAYDEWFDDVSTTRPDNYAAPRIVIDSDEENPVTLTRQDWRRTAQKGWGNRGYWMLRIKQPCTLEFQGWLQKGKPADEISLSINGQIVAQTSTDATRLTGRFKAIPLAPGDYDVTASSVRDGKAEGVFQMEIFSRKSTENPDPPSR